VTSPRAAARPALALARQAVTDLRKHHYPVEPGDLPADGSGPYPLDLRPIGTAFRLDAEGIVVTRDAGGLIYRNPVSACLHALGRHTEARRAEADGPGSPRRAAAAAQMLIQARQVRRSQDSSGGWRYPVPAPRYRVEPGWYSAMAQGLAISVLLRAFDLTSERSYLDAAEAAGVLLLRPLDAGGCADYDELGQPFLEECPSDPPSHILNGAIFALIGLRELAGRTGGDGFRPAGQRLASQLGEFDLGYWSRYDLTFTAPASHAYHCLHISLLLAAGRTVGDARFGQTADRWHRYLGRPASRLRAMAGKARFVLGERYG
jgi:heparosan-N-sulfate-glucuronate 5-epimerase